METQGNLVLVVGQEFFFPVYGGLFDAQSK